MIEVLVSKLVGLRPAAQGNFPVPDGGKPDPGLYHFVEGRTFREFESPLGTVWEVEDNPSVIVIRLEQFKPFVVAVRGGSSRFDAWSEHGDLSVALRRAAQLCTFAPVTN